MSVSLHHGKAGAVCGVGMPTGWSLCKGPVTAPVGLLTSPRQLLLSLSDCDSLFSSHKLVQLVYLNQVSSVKFSWCI